MIGAPDDVTYERPDRRVGRGDSVVVRLVPNGWAAEVGTSFA